MNTSELQIARAAKEAQDDTIWLRNSAEALVGSLTVHHMHLSRSGMLSILADPAHVQLELTPVQMRRLAAKLIVIASNIERA